jgi:hypothetical protein
MLSVVIVVAVAVYRAILAYPIRLLTLYDSICKFSRSTHRKSFHPTIVALFAFPSHWR